MEDETDFVFGSLLKLFIDEFIFEECIDVIGLHMMLISIAFKYFDYFIYPFK
jgi:hypothetical protein